MKEKRIYIIKDFKNKKLEEQLCWAQSEINELKTILFNKERIECREYEVYNCKFIDQESGKEYLLKGVVMKRSGANERNVLICPLIDTHFSELTKQGFLLGKISSLNDTNLYYARVSSLKSVSKDAFKIDENDTLNNIKPVGHISVDQFLAILTNYKIYIENIIRNNIDINANEEIYRMECAC